MDLEKPHLYRLSEDGRELRLIASRCGKCGGLSFPAALYGCLHCGAPADRSTEEQLSGRARLLSFITLRQKLGPGLEPPFVVGEAEIADGMIEEIMIGGDESALSGGMVLQAVPVAFERNGEARLACRFVPVEERR